MLLPLTIGKSSNNNILKVDLKDLPHLFISYSEPLHLQVFPGDLITGFSSKDVLNHIQYYLFLNRVNYGFLKTLLPERSILALLVQFEPDLSTIAGKNDFIKALMKIFTTRKKKAASSFTSLVVIVDDILDLIISKKKFTGQYFLEILQEGDKYGIYFVFATIRTYRNLMTQLQQEQNRCAELIINPEHFFYFKRKEEKTYTTYYPVREGRVTV